VGLVNLIAIAHIRLPWRPDTPAGHSSAAVRE